VERKDRWPHTAGEAVRLSVFAASCCSLREQKRPHTERPFGEDRRFMRWVIDANVLRRSLERGLGRFSAQNDSEKSFFPSKRLFPSLISVGSCLLVQWKAAYLIDKTIINLLRRVARAYGVEELEESLHFAIFCREKPPPPHGKKEALEEDEEGEGNSFPNVQKRPHLSAKCACVVCDFSKQGHTCLLVWWKTCPREGGKWASEGAFRIHERALWNVTLAAG